MLKINQAILKIPKPDTIDQFGRLRVHTVKYYQQEAKAAQTKKEEKKLRDIANGLSMLNTHVRSQKTIAKIKDKHKLVIELLTDYFNNYSLTQISAVTGIGIKTITKWRMDPEFMALLDQEITRKKTLLRLEAYKGWFRQIRKGNPKVIREYFKMTGDLKDSMEVNVNDLTKLNNEDLDKEINEMEERLNERVNLN